MKSFKKYYRINAKAPEIYAALTNPLALRLWTGEKAEMSTIPNSRFSLWDGSITGTNISFEENIQLTQHWDFGDTTEPSEVQILLHPHQGFTSVEVRHSNIPDEAFEEITEGWNTEYFGALAEYFSE